MLKEPSVGIDFGTTKSIVSAYVDGQPRPLADRYSRVITPSVVLVTPSGQKCVGWEAKNHPDRYNGEYVTIASVKRKLGQASKSTWLWWKGYPQEIAAYIMAELRSLAEYSLGQEIHKAVIGIPSHFNANQRLATKQAAEIAGLEPVRIVNEATVVAMARREKSAKADERRVVVFDFGGGTLDVSVIESGDGVYEVLATAGDNELGGNDFDRIIYDYLIESQEKMFSDKKIVLGSGSALELTELAEEVKRELSGRTHVEINRPGFINEGGRYVDLSFHMERATFEHLAKPLLERAKSLLEEALVAAHVKAETLDAILLTGGTSRIPCVQEMLRREFHLPLQLCDEYSVATGTAILAGMLQGDADDIILLDVLPSTLSVELKGGCTELLVEKNTTVPTEHSKTFTTTEDNQTDVVISVLEGEGKLAKENLTLGSLRLSGLIPAPATVAKVLVTFNIDGNGLLSVKAQDQATGAYQQATFTAPCQLNESQMRRLSDKVRKQSIKKSVNSIIAAITLFLEEHVGLMDKPIIYRLREYEKQLNEQLTTESPNEKLLSTVLSYITGLKKATEAIDSLESNINLLHDQHHDIRCICQSLKYLQEGVTLLRTELWSGTLTDELSERIESDFARVKDVVKRITTITKNLSALFKLSQTASDQSLRQRTASSVEESRAKLQLSKTADQAFPEAEVVFQAALVELFLRSNQHLRRDLAQGSLGIALRKEEPRIKEKLIEDLRSPSMATQRQALERLEDCLSMLSTDLSRTECTAVFDRLGVTKCWYLKILLQKCLAQLPNSSLCDIYLSEPFVKEVVKTDQAYEGLRKKVEMALNERLAGALPNAEIVREVFALTGETSLPGMLTLLKREVSTEPKIEVLKVLGRMPNPESILSIFQLILSEEQAVQDAAVDCLKQHEALLDRDMLNLSKLIAKHLNHQPLTLKERLYLYWIALAQRHGLLKKVIAFLKEQ